MERKSMNIFLVGENGVGKTCLMNRYVNNSFPPQYKTTIDDGFSRKNIQIEDELETLAPRQRRFQSPDVEIYRDWGCCLLVFDVNDVKSFDSLAKWHSKFLNQGQGIPHTRTFPFILLGNKIDIDGGNSRVVPEKTAKDWCESNGNIPYLETSAKDDINVSAAFLCAAKTALVFYRKHYTSVSELKMYRLGMYHQLEMSAEVPVPLAAAAEVPVPLAAAAEVPGDPQPKSDLEIIETYLRRVEEFDHIVRLDIRSEVPERLAEMGINKGGKWWFYSPLQQKGQKKGQNKRSNPEGKWTEKSTYEIYNGPEIAGLKRSYFFYKKTEDGTYLKTNWVYDSYTITRDDAYSLCKLRNYIQRNRKTKPRVLVQEGPEPEAEGTIPEEEGGMEEEAEGTIPEEEEEEGGMEEDAAYGTE